MREGIYCIYSLLVSRLFDFNWIWTFGPIYIPTESIGSKIYSKMLYT